MIENMEVRLTTVLSANATRAERDGMILILVVCFGTINQMVSLSLLFMLSLVFNLFIDRMLLHMIVVRQFYISSLEAPLWCS